MIIQSSQQNTDEFRPHFTQFEALSAKHIMYSIRAGTTVLSRLEQQIQTDTFKRRSRILQYWKKKKYHPAKNI